jgi:hypothetical protein
MSQLLEGVAMSSSSAGKAWFGADALNDNNYYASATAGSTGIQWSTSGGYFQAWVRINSQNVTSANRHLFGTFVTSTSGWTCRTTGSNATIVVSAFGTGPTQVDSDPYTIQPSDVGKILHLVGVHTGSALQLWVNGVQVGSNKAITSFVPGTAKMYIGRASTTGLSVLASVAVCALSGGSYVPTSTEIAAAYSAGKAKGQIVAIAGKVDHTYSYQLDQQTVSPAYLVGRNGPGIARVNSLCNAAITTAPALVTFGQWVGVNNITSTQRHTMAGSGGPSGSATTGLTMCYAVRLDAGAASATRQWSSKISGNTGWQNTVSGANAILGFQSGNGTTTYAAPTYTVQASDYGRVVIVHHVIDIANLKARQYVDGVEVGTGTTFSSFSPATSANMGMGYSTGNGNPSTSTTFFGMAGGNVALSAAEIAAHVVACQAASDVVQDAGLKLDHVWSVKQSALVSSPALLTDRTGSDNLTYVGAPTRAKYTAQQVVVNGADSFTTSNYYTTAAGVGLRGHVSGFWAGAVIRINALVATGAAEIFTCYGAGGTGWTLLGGSNYSALHFDILSGAGGQVASPSYTPTATDVGKLLALIGVYDQVAGKIRFYVEGSEVGSGTTIVGHTPGGSTIPNMIGVILGTAFPAANATIFGVGGGDGFIPTLAEIQTQYAAIKTAGDFVAIPGKTTHFWSIKQDQAGAIPATLTDRAGSTVMSKVGSPTLVTDYGLPWAA